MTTKTCPRCGLDKALGSFNHDASGADGLQRYCRQCQRAVSRAWYAAHRRTKRAYDAARRSAARKRQSSAPAEVS